MSTKRILFVDDEPNVLHGLERMLRSMRSEWETAFVQSGEEALTVLEHAPFDVIVSDMRMPGMDGAALLTAVRERYPHMVRLALSGHSQPETVLRSVGPTHQYLAKPCDAETLKNTLARACALHELLADGHLARLVSQLTSLPSLPALYVAIMEELQSPLASTRRVGEIIARDVGMTAKTLQLVNSAFFGLRRHVSNPAEAANLLGLEAIKALVLSVHVFSQLQQAQAGAVCLDALWKHSLATGTLAKRIAATADAQPKAADYALLAGLLHDTGKLILMSQCADQYAGVIALAQHEHVPLYAAERHILHASHAELGAYLLGLWGLPEAIIEAVAYHHRPAEGPHPAFGPLTAVHLANGLDPESHGVADIAPSGLDTEYVKSVGAEAHVVRWQQTGTEAQCVEAGR